MRIQRSVAVAITVALPLLKIPALTPALAQDVPASDLFAQAEVAYPAAQAPTLFGAGSASARHAAEPEDAAWATGMESQILALVQQERDRGLLIGRTDVECRTTVCALRLIHVAGTGDASSRNLSDLLYRSLGFASVSRSATEIPVVQSVPDGKTSFSFMSGYVEIVLAGASGAIAMASAGRPPAPVVSPPGPANPGPAVPGRTATIPALPGFPEYALPLFRTDGQAAQALAAEADDPRWSGGMEDRIREIAAGESALTSGIEVECRTTRCGLLAVHVPDGDRARQSGLLSRLQSRITDALGFDGSVVGTVGETDFSRFTAIYFEGFPNLRPRILPVWLLSFGLAQDPREQLMVGDEIVQARAPWVLGGMVPWLDAASTHARANAAYVFARYGDRRGIDTLSEIVLSSYGPGFLADTDRRPTPQERDHVTYLLGTLDDPRAFEMLWQVLEDQFARDMFSRDVERALARSADDSAIPFLVRQLDNRTPFLRGKAVELLAGIGAQSSLPSLELLLADQERPFRSRSETVGELAREAIATIEGREPR